MNLTHAPSDIRRSRKRMKAYEDIIREFVDLKIDRDFLRFFDANLSAHDETGGFDPRLMGT